MKAALTCLCLATTFLTTSSSYANSWGPREITSTQDQQKTNDTAPLQRAVKLFQKHVSPVDGSRCSMYPTCSGYALQALHKHGPLLGVFQTVDRLYREGDTEHEHGKPIPKWGYIRFHDPLSNNDFWLK